MFDVGADLLRVRSLVGDSYAFQNEEHGQTGQFHNLCWTQAGGIHALGSSAEVQSHRRS